MRPVIRIRLVPNIVHPTGEPAYRKQGPDIWAITLTITTSEGHVTKHVFRNSVKTYALGEAYRWLERDARDKWFCPWAVKQFQMYQEVLDKNPTVEDVFIKEMDMVESGKMKPEVFSKKWACLEQLHNHCVSAPKRAEDTYVTEKWSFWSWFK